MYHCCISYIHDHTKETLRISEYEHNLLKDDFQMNYGFSNLEIFNVLKYVSRIKIKSYTGPQKYIDAMNNYFSKRILVVFRCFRFN